MGGFVSDLSVAGMVHAALIRSPAARGTIRDIQSPPLPDGFRLITAEDIPGANMLRAFDSSMPVLAELKVCYEGEPVAILAGPDKDMVGELRDRVTVEVAAQPAVVNFEKFSSDQVERRRSLLRGDPDAAFASATGTVEGRYRTGPQEHYYPEPCGALATFEGGKLVLRAATQWPFHVRATVSDLLDIDEEDIVVKAAELAAPMDGKLWYPSLVAAQAALAAFLLQRPAKLLLDRREDFLYSPKRARASLRHRAAYGPGGALSAIDAQVLLDVGAYGPLADEMLDRLCAAAAGAYCCPNARIEAYAISTSSPPMGAFAGLGMAPSFFAMEMQAARIARMTDSTPEEWRARNALRQGDEKLSGGRMDKPVPSDGLLERLCALSDFKRKHASYELRRKRGADPAEGPRRGIGLGFCYQEDGMLDPAKERDDYSVEVELGKDSSLEIRTSAVPGSASVRGLWRSIASERLSIPPEQVRVAEPSTDKVPDSGPSTLSRNIAAVTSLIEKCVAEIQRKRFRSPLPILARKRQRPARRGGAAEGSGSAPFQNHGWAGAVVEAEVDEASLEIKPLRAWICVDGGTIASEPRARAAIEAGVAAALGWAQAERLAFFEGAVEEESFFRYRPMPLSEMPPVVVEFLASADSAPRKGIGELPYHCVPAAFAQALAQATGRDLQGLPLPPAYCPEEEGE